MKLNLSKKLEKVNNYFFRDNDFVIWDVKGLKIENKLIQLEKPNEIYSFNNSFLVIMDEFSKSRFINVKLNIDKISNYIKSVSKFINETTIFQTEWNEDFTELNLKKTDIIEEKTIWQNNLIFTPLFIYDNHFIASNSDTINKIFTTENRLVWTFNLSQLPSISSKEFANPNAPWEIKKIIGVLDNKLWVAMNHRTIIALSIETGDLVHIISEIPNFEMEWIHNSIPSPEATQIIENENILLGFVDAFVWKINAETGEISIKDYTPYFKENRIMNYRNEFIIDKELLFFLSDTDSKVGCFNRNTEQLEWQHSFDKDETGYAPRLVEIQGNRNKLGVKDLNNTLYIFENVN